MISLNNKLILKPYEGSRSIEKKVQGGFTSLIQRSTLIGLEVLADTTVVFGNNTVDIKKGQKAYFYEEMLFGQDWSKMKFSCDGIKEQFIIADGSAVVMVK